MLNPGTSSCWRRTDGVYEGGEGRVALDDEGRNLMGVSRTGHEEWLTRRGAGRQVYALRRMCRVRDDVHEECLYCSDGRWRKAVATRSEHDAASGDSVDFERNEI